MMESDFSERLRKLYDDSEYRSVTALGRACRVNPNILYKYMVGDAYPSFKVLLKLRYVWKDLDYNWLLFGKSLNGKS